MDSELIPLIAYSLFLIALGIGLCWLYQKSRGRTYQQLAVAVMQQAEKEAQALKLEKQREWDLHLQAQQKKLQSEHDRVQEREEKLEKRLAHLERRSAEVEKREAQLDKQNKQTEAVALHVTNRERELLQELQRMAGIQADEAKDLLLSRLKVELQSESAQHIRVAQHEMQEQAERLAKTVLATAIQRLAVACVAESTTTTVAIPGDEIKARIIGREGRNVRHLERLTGITFLIDDTPGAVVLSGFDPIRKHIAKMALTELVQDGRIHPTRIEEAVEKAQVDMEQQIRHYGHDAAMRVGALGLHPELIQLLGKLKFRTSYGQNVLEHSLEVAHLMGLMASELGLDADLAKRIGLLHDVGKAVSQEVPGSHATVGHDLALKFGETAAVANGIGCHHGEISPTTIEGSLCGTADALSAARPGARLEAVEEYLKRLRKLEEIANGFAGVEKAYAMQAGREILVSVIPDQIDDAATMVLSRDIARRVEKELSYPGKIKITVIREKKAIQYAL